MMNIILGILCQCFKTFDLKINVGASNLYFTFILRTL